MISTECTAAAPAPAEPELIPLRAFLRRFSVSKSTFYRLAAQGKAPPVVQLGRAVYVPLAQARAWMNELVRPAATLCSEVRHDLRRSPPPKCALAHASAARATLSDPARD